MKVKRSDSKWESIASAGKRQAKRTTEPKKAARACYPARSPSWFPSLSLVRARSAIGHADSVLTKVKASFNTSVERFNNFCFRFCLEHFFEEKKWL